MKPVEVELTAGPNTSAEPICIHVTSEYGSLDVALVSLSTQYPT